MKISEKIMSASYQATSNLDQRKALLLVILGIMTVVAAILPGGHGIFVNDEGTYLLMAKNLTHSGGLAIWNGYEEFATRELLLPHTFIHDGRLVPSYPYLFPVLAAPFYWLAGFRGLIILNAIAYIAVLGLCFRLAKALFRDTALALNACLILGLATFSWEYSQAAYPHAASMLFVTGAVYLVVVSTTTEYSRKAILLALAGGGVAGLGVGIRFDVAFVFPVLMVPFVFMRPWRPWCVVAVCLGAMPGLAFLAATNYAKFGAFSIFAYSANVLGGTADPRSYLPIVLIGLAILAAAWFITRDRRSTSARRGRWLLASGLIVLAGIIIFEPTLRSLLVRMTDGTYQLLVDLRMRDVQYSRPNLIRGPGGSFIYIGGLKKALLQSCPYLVALVLPAAALFRRPQDSLAIGMLFLVSASFVAPYAYFFWDGGTGLNLRYFVTILPFTSILVAYAWRAVTKDLDGYRIQLYAVAAGAAAALYGLFIILGPAIFWEAYTLAQLETIFLTLPLVLASVTLVLAVGLLVGPVTFLRNALPALFAIGFVWSGMIEFSADYPRVHASRSAQAAAAQTMANAIEKDSLVVTSRLHYFSGLPDDYRVRIAMPQWDDFETFHDLVGYHLDRERPVYLWVNEFMEREIQARRLLDAYSVTPVREFRGDLLVQLARARDKHGTAAVIRPQTTAHRSRP